MFNIQLFLGFLLAAVFGFLAWKAKSLNRSGAWMATITGGLIFGLGGLPWSVIMIAFFLSSSILSRLYPQNKEFLNEKYAKGSQRDWGQVLANGGLGAILVIVHATWPLEFWPWLAYAGAMASVTADTWATELGVLSKSNPRLITSGNKVEAGTSGGVTLAGMMASIGGGAGMGLLAGIFSPEVNITSGLFIGSLAGLAGSLFDSVLGATVQAIYYCPHDNKETEQHPTHHCGTPTSLKRGWWWLNNDWVNFFSSVFGGAVAVLIWKLLV